MGSYLSSIFGGKPWYQSLTAWGLVAYGVGGQLVETACGPTGLLSAETCAQLGGAVETLGAVLAGLGVRKAATAPNVK